MDDETKLKLRVGVLTSALRHALNLLAVSQVPGSIHIDNNPFDSALLLELMTLDLVQYGQEYERKSYNEIEEVQQRNRYRVNSQK